MRKYKAMEMMMMMMIETQTKFVDELPDTEVADFSGFPDAAVRPSPNPPRLPQARKSSPYLNNNLNALLNLSNSSPSRSSLTRNPRRSFSVILTVGLQRNPPGQRRENPNCGCRRKRHRNYRNSKWNHNWHLLRR
jgi:hypothetical protein